MFILNPQITDANLASTEAKPSLGLDKAIESDAFAIQFNAFLQHAKQVDQTSPLIASAEAEKAFPLAGESGKLQNSALSGLQPASLNDLQASNIGLQDSKQSKNSIDNAVAQISTMMEDEIVVTHQAHVADSHMSMKNLLASDHVTSPEYMGSSVDRKIVSMQTEHYMQENSSQSGKVDLDSLGLDDSTEFDLDHMLMSKNNKINADDPDITMNKPFQALEGSSQQQGADRLFMNAGLNQSTVQHNIPENLISETGQYTIKADEKFSEQLTEKVNMLIQRQKNEAHIQLEPAELGRLDVFVKLNKNNEYLINIVSHNDHAQHLLDEQSDKLKSFFSGEEVSFNFSKKDDQQNSNGAMFDDHFMGKSAESIELSNDAKLSTHYIDTHLSSQISLFA